MREVKFGKLLYRRTLDDEIASYHKPTRFDVETKVEIERQCSRRIIVDIKNFKKRN